MEAVLASDRALVACLIGEADARPPRVLVRVLKSASAGAAGAAAGEDQRARTIAGAWIGRVRIERRVLVVHFGARELVVEAEAERQRQAVVQLELVVQPRRRIRLSECRLDRNRLVRCLHLPEEERRKWIAGLTEVVAGRVVPAGAEPIEVELSADCANRPSAEREIVVAV